MVGPGMGGADPALPELDLQRDPALTSLLLVKTAPLSVKTSPAFPTAGTRPGRCRPPADLT